MLSTQEENLFNDFAKDFTDQSKYDYHKSLVSFKQYLQEKDLTTVHHTECSEYIEQLNNVYSESTREKVYSYIHSYYEYLKVNKIIDFNPFRNVKKPYVTRDKGKDSILSFDEINLLIQEVKHLDNRDKAILTILMTTGCHLNEVALIRWSDLLMDEDNNVYCNLGRGANARTIKLHPSAFKYIIEYRLERGLPESICPEDSFVFVGKRGNSNSITDRTVQNIVSKTFKACGMDYSAKDLRHTFASFCLYFGIDKNELKEQMGWKDTQQAIRYKYLPNFINSKAIDTLINNEVFDI
jgi:site-specific recombinase XerD